MAKKTAYVGVLTALAFVFSYIEFLIPIQLGIPGIKLGLANMVIILALYTIGAGPALLLSLVRIVLTGFTFGSLSTMLYSLAGGILSFLVMLSAKKTKLLSPTGVSVLGAVFHNVGQIIVAMLVLETKSLIYYLPVLLLFGIIAGVAIGLTASILIRRLGNYIKDSTGGGV